MARWEYARLESSDNGISVVFTHRQAWTGLAPESFFDTLRRLGDEGWELVTALPLAAHATYEGGPPETAPRTMHLQLVTDRWLVFKRPQPEPSESGGMRGADLVKGLVGRQLLKGGLPLP